MEESTEKWTCLNCEKENESETQKCLYCKTSKPILKNVIENKVEVEKKDFEGSEKLLSTIANIILIIGIIIPIALIAQSMTALFEGDSSFEPVALVVAFSILFSSIFLHALLKIVCNISSNLHQINIKLK